MRTVPTCISHFTQELFKLLPVNRNRAPVSKGKASREMIAMLSKWRHSRFHVFCGNRIQPKDETATENLARYIIWASFSQERMQYLDQEAKVVYTSKVGKSDKVFDTLEWLAAMCTHIPDKGEQMVILPSIPN